MSRLKQILSMDLRLPRRKPAHGRYKGPAFSNYLLNGSSRRRNELTEVFELLSMLVNSNVPIFEGMQMAALEAKNPRTRAVLEGLVSSLGMGIRLWEAMAAQTRFFPRDYCDLIRCAEETGNLGETVKEILATLNRESEISRKTYQIIAFLAGETVIVISILFFMVLFVLPTFEEIAYDFGSSTPWFTNFVFQIDDLLWYNPTVWQIGIPVIVGLTIAVVILARAGVWRRIRDGEFRQLPIITRFAREMALCHISRILALLLKARMPIDEAIQACAEGNSGRLYRKRLLAAREKVAAGSTIADAFQAVGGFPKGYIAQVRVAEYAGELPETLEVLSLRYETRSRTRIRILAELIAPVLTLLLGAIVLGVELAVFGLVVALSNSMSLPI